jgi:hypothetical protein
MWIFPHYKDNHSEKLQLQKHSPSLTPNRHGMQTVPVRELMRQKIQRYTQLCQAIQLTPLSACPYITKEGSVSTA